MIELIHKASDSLSCLQKPTCAFVKPLQLGRWLATPREAARFVSLLQPKEGAAQKLSTASPAESWAALHTVIESRQALQVRLLWSSHSF